MAKRTHQVEVKIDADRFLDEVSVKDMIALESGERTFSSMANVVKLFIWKDGAYMDPDEAMTIVEEFSIRQLKDTVDQLMQSAEDEAVPPANGQESSSV